MLALSNVTNAVPATDEYAVLICLVDTPGPRSTSKTVKPVLKLLWDHMNRNPLIISTYFSFTPSCEVIGESPVSDPPAQDVSAQFILCKWNWLFCTSNNPVVAVPNSCSLETTDVTTSKGLANSQSNVFFACQCLITCQQLHVAHLAGDSRQGRPCYTDLESHNWELGAGQSQDRPTGHQRLHGCYISQAPYG